MWMAGFLVLAALASVVAPSGTPIVAQEGETPASRGKALFTEKGCYGCHTIGAMGTPIGPDLSRAGRKYREADLARWLMEPSAPRPMRHMPKLELSETEARALAAFLASLP
jgi:cytochrome c oxidase subunit 2